MSIIKTYETEIDHVVLKVRSKDKLFDVLIDFEDLDKVIGNSITVNFQGNNLYRAVIYCKKSKEKRPLGRHILGIPNGEGYGENMRHVDHINHNDLDNRKKNLRYVTVSENSLNKLPKCKQDGIYVNPSFIYV